MATETFRVGRDLGRGPLVPCCTLQRSDDGHVAFADEDPAHAMSDAERRLVLAHLGRPQVGLVSKTDPKTGREAWCLDKPEVGTVEHFRLACDQLPKPFHKMPGGAK